MSYTISKEFHFSASHQLRDLSEDHQCARLHGHNYILTVRLTGSQLDKTGFILDYGQLGFVGALADHFDHRHLNDIFDFNPTSENICRYIFDIVADALKTRKIENIEQLSIGLSETPKTTAWYERWL